MPAFEHIERRGLDSQIDYIVYSSDFPTAIGLEGDFPGVTFPVQLNPTASLNSATFLSQGIMTKSRATISLSNNRYARLAGDQQPTPAVHGFRSWYGWGPAGQLLEAGGTHYLLSTLLAVTSGRGNSTSEAIRYLHRSAAADGTHPRGTIYYMQNGDVRSQVRDAGFAPAAARLRELGVRAVVETGVIPLRRPDVQGMTLGAKQFDWARSGSTILPARCASISPATAAS